MRGGCAWLGGSSPVWQKTRSRRSTAATRGANSCSGSEQSPRWFPSSACTLCALAPLIRACARVDEVVVDTIAGLD